MKVIIEAKAKIMAENENQAKINQEFFKKSNLYCLNFMSSPGSGKTTLLEYIIKNNLLKLCVIEGDLETNKDADRIIKAGAKAYQISTGQSCHLDAKMIDLALKNLDISNSEFCVIENIGNLVCPASYKLGENLNVVLLSSPEGSDKVAKYPVMFKRADVIVLTKMDIAKYFDFSLETIMQEAKKLNPNVKIFCVSSTTGEGIAELCEYFKSLRS
ncbi:hydrogenase nickel incorporation protein HypB [Campylobacter sp. 2018MI01]|uniref:hydrogenase nickel incorporation protein HypB n=1 Tax=Campylobacter sp. 2018MI01 TaxID=2836735 RepID=UPI001BD98746|nr:hydrogenase nickel incorporation protein HypB [Campylobacter sp. 2018MI01]MBT0878820.1 hydrogenase nickel incorporation protein HypB [Campylobacter sp. 2018MI01]